MKPKTTSIAITLGLIVLTLSAGVMAGMLIKRIPAANQGTDPSVRAGSLSEQLQLTAEQQKQLRTIWEAASVDIRDCYRQAQDIQKRRDQEIVALMSESQKAEFEKLAKRYSDEYVQLTQSREHTFDQAVARTRSLLDAGQRAKYDVILKSRLGRLPTASAGDDFLPRTENAHAALN